MPINEYGFKRRTYDEILTDKIAKAKELFGEDIETNDLTPLGKFIRINAYDQAITEEEAEMIYYSIFPTTAIGTSLDRLAVFAGIKRNVATKARYTAKITGKAGATVAVGFLVGTESGINFSVIGTATVADDGVVETAEGDVTIGEDETVLVTVECVESGGIGNVLVKEINTIVNPSADVSEVIGEGLISKGAEVESDLELRRRFSSAIEGMGSCNEPALKSALLRIPTVTHAGVITDETNGSFECYVNGNEEYYEQIAKAIFEKKPIGIKTTGAIEQEFTDSSGKKQVIKFSRTSNISVYVQMAIKTNVEFSGNAGLEEIKDNICSYIDNIGIGNSLVLSSLYGKIHSVTGVTEVTELKLSTNGENWSTDNIAAAEYENCVCYEVRIKQNDGTDYEVI